MELDELKNKWKQYDDKLKTHSLLNEHALRNIIDANHSKKASASEYYSIAFSALVFIVFGLFGFGVHNNPPMLLAVVAVLVVTAVSMGMSIYKVAFLPRSGNDGMSDVIVTGMSTQLAMRGANLFSMLFSPVLIIFLFLLLFFGMSVKTF